MLGVLMIGLLLLGFACGSPGLIPFAEDGRSANELLASHGVIRGTPPLLDLMITQLDECIRTRKFLPYPVKSPAARHHLLLMPEDCDGTVAEAVRGMVSWLGGVFPSGSLVELAAFVVDVGAKSQQLHADVHHDGYVSCQLALHDTLPGSGGLAVLPGSMHVQALGMSWQSLLEMRAGGDTEALAQRGEMVCYDGRVWHRGVAHVGLGIQRRVIYFTMLSVHGKGGVESALHPRLRCAPLNNAPLLQMSAFTTNSSLDPCPRQTEL